MRSVTLYFASVGVAEAARLAAATVTAPLASAARRRERLHEAVGRSFGGAVAFSYASGRGALAACLQAAGVGAGDEVLLSSYTCLAVPTAVIAAGATPTYSDIDASTMNVTLDSVRGAITPRTRAIVVQHTLGSVAPIGEIAELARARGILVIEDCALAIGTTVNGRAVGSIGDAAIFSLELSKTLSVGWGGLLVVHAPPLVERVREHYAHVPDVAPGRVRRMAFQTAVSGVAYKPSVYWLGKYAVHLGFKYGAFAPSTPQPEFEGVVAPDFVAKLPGPHAALAYAQWRRLPAIAARCAANADRIRGFLNRLGYDTLGDPDDATVCVTPRVAFLVRDRRELIAVFERESIAVGTWFDQPLSPMPTAARFNYDVSRFPVAASVARHVVNLPSHSRIARADIDAMEAVMNRHAASHGADADVLSEPARSA